jgi:hypothetical protein
MFSRKLDITLSYFVELVNNLFVSLFVSIILIGSSTIDIIHGKEKYKTKLQITHYLWIFLSKLIQKYKINLSI